MDTHERDEETGTIVFVLGAGCSKDCGAPIMVDFMKQARENARRSDCPFKEDYERMLKFRRECMRISYVLDLWWESIEDLFTQAHLRELAGVKDSSGLCDALLRATWDVYRSHRPGEDTGYDYFWPLLYCLAVRWNDFDMPRPVVVTTNYDIHLECTMAGASMGGAGGAPCVVMYSGDWRSKLVGAFVPLEAGMERQAVDPDFELLEEPGNRPVEVIKLHGSVNWFKRGERATPILEQEIVGSGGGSPHKFRKHRCQDPDFANNLAPQGQLKPLIVAPMLGKADNCPIITTQWKRAVHAFKCAREILIIGYSFPQTDTFMTRLLAEGVRDNKQLERIAVFNPEPDDAWWMTVEQMFARSWWRRNAERYRIGFAQMCRGFNRASVDTTLASAKEQIPFSLNTRELAATRMD